MTPLSSQSGLKPARRAIFPGLAALFAPALLQAKPGPAQTITVGALLSLSGNWSDLGTQCKLMLQIGSADMEEFLSHVNASPSNNSKFAGVNFELLIEDTALDPQRAVTAATSLIRQGVDFIIGPQSSSEVSAIKKITDAAGVVQVSPGSTAGTLSLPNDTVFRFVPDDSQESKAIVEVAAQQGVTTICPVWRADDGNRGLVNALRLFGPGAGIQVLPGMEYPTTGANFPQIAGALSSAVSALNPTKTAIFMAAFDEGADLLTAAGNFAPLLAVKWFAGDGVTLSSAYLQSGPAQFAETTGLVAPTLALPASAQSLRDPILQKTALAGVPSPLAFAFAGYDAFACCTLAWLLAGGDRTKIQDVLPGVARNYFGTTGWCLLNANGDRAIADFEFFGIAQNLGVPVWTSEFTHQVGA